MFKDCKNLTTVPNLPATTLAEECYYKMFDGCTSLKIKQQDTKTEDEGYIFTCPGEGGIPKNAVTNMFHDCACTGFEDTPNPGKSYY
ncbi:MAG: hypothetical protein MJ219_00560 [Mycoplasmoidaceae bacterium]|nr:hypothetical protein [Mycoplasmoidaceae bacterium]